MNPHLLDGPYTAIVLHLHLVKDNEANLSRSKKDIENDFASF